MNELSDLSKEVIDRALNSLASEIPPQLHAKLKALVASGEIYNGELIATAIANVVNLDLPDAN